MNEKYTIQSEADDNIRLNRAKQSLDSYRQAEIEARRILAAATESIRIAKEKYETLFAECEKRAVARRKSGQIAVSSQY